MADPIEFRILGPLEIHSGRSLTVAAAKPRALLAALLLSANQVCPVDRLSAVLWDEDPPLWARNLISGYVGQLRKMLPAERAFIRTTPAGYLIELRPDELDLLRFQHGVRLARSSLASGEPERAAEQLAAALALWRGHPLSDVESTSLQLTEVPRLMEERREAEQLRVELELQLGRHEAVVPALTTLLAEFPLAEDLYRLLMIALHRSGRRGEALAVYETARQTLDTELGVEPGRPLRDTAEAVRQDDVEPARPQVPAELPPDLADFTGRNRQLADLVDLLAESGLGVVTGPAGVGKTALALHAAWQVRERFPDGQLFADLGAGRGERRDPADVLALFLAALGLGASGVPQAFDQRLRLYRSLVADRRLLVVLDDVMDEAQVRPLLPTGPGSAVVTTSRRPLPGLAAARWLQLDLLDPAEARRLLGRIVGRARVSSNPAASDELIRLCGHLPLAVRVAGARLASRPDLTVEDLVRRLTDEHDRLDELVAGDVGVRASFEVSYRGCDEPLRRAFRRFGLLTTAEPPAWAIAALVPEESRVDRLLDELVDARLLVPVGRAAEPRYRCHDLLLVFARERLAAEETTDSRAAALHSLCAVQGAAVALAAASIGADLRHVALAGVAGPVAEPLAAVVRQAPVRWYRAERHTLSATVSAVAAAAAEGAVDAGWVWRLALAQNTLAQAAADWAKRAEVLELAAATLGESGPPGPRIAVWTALGELQVDLANWPAAERHLATAMAAATDAADPLAIALVQLLLGMMYRDAGRAADAVRALRPAMAAFREHGDLLGEVRARFGLALVRLDVGHNERAVQVLDECQRLAEPLGQPWSTRIHTYLAKAHRASGRHHAALDELTRALPLFVASDDEPWHGAALRELGENLNALGRYREALIHLRQARAIFVRIGDPHWRGYLDCALGDTYRHLGEHGRAASSYRAADEALALYDDERGKARARAGLASVLAPLDR